jgi:hypothetical protein
MIEYLKLDLFVKNVKLNPLGIIDAPLEQMMQDDKKDDKIDTQALEKDLLSGGGQELLYAPAEGIFSVAGPKMASLGWSVYPQEPEGRRMPGRVLGDQIKPVAVHDLENKLPTPEAMKSWAMHCATLNVACMFGKASGYTFALDIDITDEALCLDVVSIAEEILGPTPFMREGMAPKIAMIYRHAPEEKISNLSRYFTITEEDGTVRKSDHGVEIISSGKQLTFHGRHHKTGRYFRWLDDTPLLSGPEAVPLVSSLMVKAFLDAVDAKYHFHRGNSYDTNAVTWEWDKDSGVAVPKLSRSGQGVPWTENDEGIIVNGREEYLRRLVFLTLRRHRDILMDSHTKGHDVFEKFLQNITGSVVDEFKRTADATGRWVPSKMTKEAYGKVLHLANKVIDGIIELDEWTAPHEGPKFVMEKAVKEKKTKALVENERKPSNIRKISEIDYRESPEEEIGSTGYLDIVTSETDDELAFIKVSGRTPIDGRIEVQPATKELEIPLDRNPIANMVQAGLREAFDSFFHDVYGDDGVGGDGRKARVHILSAPTGAGKTSRFIAYTAQDKRTYQDFITHDENNNVVETTSPIIMLLPTYANIDEVRSRASTLNLDGNLSNDELRQAAAALGLIPENEIDDRIEELRKDTKNCAAISREVSGDDRGLITMTYSGKIKAGCMMADKVSAAMSAGVGTAAFCQSSIRDPQTKEVREEKCIHYNVCPAISQRQQIAGAHVVFMPHSFLSLAIPEELMHARAIVADERIHHLFLHTSVFSLTSLMVQRKQPKLTKQEKKEGMETQELLVSRNEAAHIATSALSEGKCPAQVLFELPDIREYKNGKEKIIPQGFTLVRHAIRVCNHAILRDGDISPSMSFDEVSAYCKRPTGVDIREELEFWKIIENRMQTLTRDGMVRDSIANLKHRLDQTPLENQEARWEFLTEITHQEDMLRARGERDYRIQLLEDSVSDSGDSTQKIRISWRTEPNWPNAPVLLLDASAAPSVVAKVWNIPEKNIVVHNVVEDFGKSLNVRIVAVPNMTFSNTSLAASPDASVSAKSHAAQNLAKVRNALSLISAMYADGRVVAGANIMLREIINDGWKCPENIDWCHFGALRGLDVFKNHSAAISIGRMEVPFRSIDGLAAALTYDDPIPELPFDVFGTGFDHEGKSLRLPMEDQRIRLRNGSFAITKIPTYHSVWARLMQQQYREEELLQFVGRLRPVYRQGRPPVWFALTSIIPETLIVDDIIHIDDLLGGVPKGKSLWEAIRRLEGVIEPELIAYRCPDLFKDYDFVLNALKENGFDALSGKVEGRLWRGFRIMKWRVLNDNEWRYAGIRISNDLQKDAQKHFHDVMFQILNLKIESELHYQYSADDEGAHARLMAKVRLPDTVDIRLGEMAKRTIKEDERLDRIGEEILNSTGEISSIGDTRTFEYNLDGVSRSYTLQELEALFSIEDRWNKVGGGTDNRIQPLLEELDTDLFEGMEYDNYEKMGVSIRDSGD